MGAALLPIPGREAVHVTPFTNRARDFSANRPRERTFEESRRRTKVIPRFPGERSCLTLMYATLITVARTWRGIPMTAKTLRALDKLRAATPAIGKELAVA